MKTHIQREARRLFRLSQYKDVIDLLENIERDVYLQSLYERSKQGISDFPHDNKDRQEESQESEDRASEPDAERESLSFFERLRLSSQKRRYKKQQIIQEALSKKQELVETVKQPSVSGKKESSLAKFSRKTYETKRAIEHKKSDILLVEHLELKQKMEDLKKQGREDKALAIKVKEQEFALAQNIQTNLLPKVDANVLSGMDTYVYSLSASQLSGDVFDFVTGNEQEMLFYLGDVTGHGTGAGLIMSMINCLTHSIIKRTTDVREVITTLNKEIKPKISVNMFTSMVLCKWHQSLKTFTFCGAGHEYIIHYKKRTGEIVKIPAGGVAIGMIPDIAKMVKSEDITLENGDIVVLYTDGLDEAWNQNKTETFGVDRVIESLRANASFDSAKKIGEAMFDEIRKFQGKGERTDDMTLMVFRRTFLSDEKEVRSEFLKSQFKLQILKNAAKMKSNTSSLNPDMKESQDQFVQNNFEYARILIDEEKYIQARELLEEVLRVTPNFKEAVSMLEMVEALIVKERQSRGIYAHVLYWVYKLEKWLISSLQDPKKAYSKVLSQDFDALLDQKKFVLAEEKLRELERFDTQLRYYPKARQRFENARASFEPVLEKAFSLEVQTIQKEVSKKTISPQETVSMKAFSLNLPGEKAPVVNSLAGQSVSSGFDSSKLFNGEDVLGIKKLLQKELQKTLKPDEKDALSFESKESSIAWNQDLIRKKRKPYNAFMARISKMNKKDLFNFIEKLRSFVKAGISIQRSVEIIQEQSKNDGFIYVLDEVLKELDAGKMLSQALRRFPEHFPEMFTFLVHAGEKAGALPVVLSDLADQIKEQQMVRSKVRSAMIYPVVVISISILLVTGMILFVVPRLVKLYEETQVDLPLLTQWIINFSNFLQENLFITLLGLGGGIFLLYAFGKTQIGRKIYHKIHISFPVFGELNKQTNVMLITSNLGMLIQNGIQIIDSLQVVEKIVPNHYYKELIHTIREKMIDSGVSLSQSIEKYDTNMLIPLEVRQAIEAGEQTGNIGKMMFASGEMYRDAIKNSVKGLSEAVEPLMIIAMGIFIAIIVVAVMLPLFNIGQALRKF